MVTERIEIIINERGSRTVRRSVDAVGASARRAQGGVALLTRALGTIGVGVAVQQLSRLSDTYTNIQNRLRLVTSGTSELRAVQTQLLGIANRSRSDFESLAVLYQRTATATRELGVSSQRVATFVDLLAQSTVISGASAIEATNAIRQLTQGFASGQLRGEEFRSVAEQLPFVLQVVGEATGRTAGELRDLAFAGQLTPELIINSFEQMEGSIRGSFSAMQVTIGQAITVFQNNLLAFVGGTAEATNASRILAQIVLTLGQNIDVLALAVAGLATILITRFTVAAIAGAIAGVASLVTSIGGAVTAIRAFTTAVVAHIAVTDGLVVSLFAGRTAISILSGVVLNASLTFGTLRAAVISFTTATAASFTSVTAFRAAVTALATTALVGLRTAFFAAAGAVRAFTVAIITNPLLTAISLALLAGVVLAIQAIGGAVSDVTNRMLGLNAATADTTTMLSQTSMAATQAATQVQGYATAADTASSEYVRLNTINVSTVEGLQSVAVSAEEAAVRVRELGTRASTATTRMADLGAETQRVQGELQKVGSLSAEAADALQEMVSQDIINGLGELRGSLGQVGAELVKIEDNANSAARAADDLYTQMVAGADNAFLSISKTTEALERQRASAIASAAAGARGVAGGTVLDVGGPRGTAGGGPRRGQIERTPGSLVPGRTAFGGRTRVQQLPFGDVQLDVRRDPAGRPLLFNQGGEFTVGGRGGIDRNLLSINGQQVARVSRGERVTVEPTGGRRGRGDGSITFNIQTPDIESFQRNIGQLLAKAHAAQSRQSGRNN